ncbi:MAG: hypothetical protein JSS23_00135 [Proteobacteria bacterium]|nr:hypothetical protein [Pseudomonadota bacterium]
MKHLLASAEVRATRRKVCDHCPHRKGAFCGLCRCPIVMKTLGREASCPAQKW